MYRFVPCVVALIRLKEVCRLQLSLCSFIRTEQ